MHPNPRSRALFLVVTIGTIGLAGCQAVTDPTTPGAIAALDETTFQCTVEPILIRDCSYLACHGNAGFALRVFSIGKLRATPAANLDDLTAPMTTDERHQNYLSAVAFTWGGVKPADNWLIRKPLPAGAGGYEHIGGAIFTGTDDARAVAISAWLSGKTATCTAGTP